MQQGYSRRALAAVCMAISVGTLAACGDARINQLTVGISRDSALKVINAGAAGDSLARVYKQENYLMNGRSTSVLFYNKDGIKQASDSALAAKEQVPIVTVGGKVTGWGWKHYHSVATAMKFKPSPGP